MIQGRGQAFVVGPGAAALPLAEKINAPLPRHDVKVRFQRPLVVDAQGVDLAQQLHKGFMYGILGQRGIFDNARGSVQHKAVVFAVNRFKFIFIVIAVQRSKIENKHEVSS